MKECNVKKTITVSNHSCQIGDWLRIDGKLYRIVEPITASTFTIAPISWFDLVYVRCKHLVRNLISTIKSIWGEECHTNL